MDNIRNVESYHERWITKTIRDRKIAEVVAVVEDVQHWLIAYGPIPNAEELREWAAAYVAEHEGEAG